MKKFLTIVVSAAMVMAMAIGCGGGGEKETTTEAPEETTAATESEQDAEDAEAKEDDAPPAADVGLAPVKANGTYKIGCSIAERDQFLSYLQDAIVSEAQGIGLDITALDAGDNANSQLQHIQYLSPDYDAIIVNPVDAGTVPTMEEEAGDIPIIYVNHPRH